MKYALKKKNNYKVLYSYDKAGFVIESLKDSSKYRIEVSRLTLIDKDLITYYITKLINRKFDKLFAHMYRVLTDDEDDSNTPLILDEISKLKSIVIMKYKEYVSEEIYKDIMKKLIIAEDEFRKEYNQKMFVRNIISEADTQIYEESKGKSR